MHSLLTSLLGSATPSRPQLGRLAHAAGPRASAVLAVLDDFSRVRTQQIAADEIFSGKQPILMTVEQQSLCWLGGRLASSCDGTEWRQEFRTLPNAEQITCDRGGGLRKGLQLGNAERAKQGLPAIGDQSDHFHPLRRAQQALHQRQCEAARALAVAEQAQAAYDKDGRQGRRRTGMQGRALNQKWHQAEAAFDRWTAYERALGRIQTALQLFSPDGELNHPESAEATVQAALAEMTGPGLDKVERGLGPEAFTFLRRTQEQLQALEAPPEIVQAAVQVEGLRQRPERLRGEGTQAQAARGLLLAAGLVVALAGDMGQQTLQRVRSILAGAWRASSLVEGVNSVVRMHQGRQKRLTQGLMDLKRLHWNVHEFAAGKRKRSSPYGRLGLVLPPGSWWELLQRPPEQLRQELSALNPAA